MPYTRHMNAQVAAHRAATSPRRNTRQPPPMLALRPPSPSLYARGSTTTPTRSSATARYSFIRIWIVYVMIAA
uniref:Uncharacterized protein n=1 Tax=Arundo donax TaxID=35708 RepID=A0A0A8YDH9_ARUDO